MCPKSVLRIERALHPHLKSHLLSSCTRPFVTSTQDLGRSSNITILEGSYSITVVCDRPDCNFSICEGASLKTKLGCIDIFSPPQVIAIRTVKPIELRARSPMIRTPGNIKKQNKQMSKSVGWIYLLWSMGYIQIYL